jgi:DNA end-binding protein Ku
VAKFVLRSHEYLAAILVDGAVLVLNVLRFAHDLRPPERLAVPEQDLRRLKITERDRYGERISRVDAGPLDA